MSPLKASASAAPGAPRVRAALLLTLLAACAWLALAALHGLLRHRMPLDVLWGGTRLLLLALLAASALALAALAATARAALAGRGPPGWWFVRAAAYVALLGGAACVLWLQPYRTLVVQLAAGVAAGAFAALVLGAGPLAARVPRRVRSGLDLALLNAAVVVLGAELGLRAWAASSDSTAFAPAHADAAAMIERWKLRPGQVGPGFLANAQGCMDGEFTPGTPEQPVACTIGDSFSASLVPHWFHFTTVAERLLGGMPVHNVGMAAIGPREYEHLLRTLVLKLRPDVVVVDLFVGNDLTAPLDEPSAAAGGALREVLDRERLLLARLPRLWNVDDPVPHAEPAVSFPAGGGALDEADLLRLYPWLADPLRELTPMNPSQYRRLESSRARDACGPVPPPWPALFETLRRMRDDCAAEGITFGVLLIPDEFQVEERVWNLVLQGLPGENLDRDLPQRMLSAFCAAEDIPCLDLLPTFRAVPPLPDGDRHLYHRDDSHWNRRGNDVAGRALANFVRTLRSG